jgi:hypothetical protein
MWEVVFERLKSVGTDVDHVYHSLLGLLGLLEPKPYTSAALMAKYLNARQRNLGTIINQTVYILQHDSRVDRVDRGLGVFSSRPNRDTPTPSSAGECVPPPPLFQGGHTRLLERRRGREDERTVVL